MERFISEREINRVAKDREVRIVNGAFVECPVDYLDNAAIITFGLTWSPKWIGAYAVREKVGDITAEDAAQWVATKYGRNVQLYFTRLGRNIDIRPAVNT